MTRLAGSAAVLLSVLAAWSVASATGAINPLLFPAPWAVLRAIPAMLRDRVLFDIGATSARVGGALSLAIVCGVPLGLSLGASRRLHAAVEKPLDMLRSVPAIALFPILLVVVGVGDGAIVALGAYPSALILLVQTAMGARLANPRRVHQARVLGTPAHRMLMDVYLPEALPHVLAGLRTAVSYCLALELAVEMLVGVGGSGLGRRIYEYQTTFRVPETLAAILLAGLLGVSLNFAVSIVERRALRWLPHAH